MPDPVPIRETVVAKVAERLELISRANGYEFDVTKVWQEEKTLQTMPTPGIAIIQRIESTERGSIERHMNRVLLINIAFVDSFSGDDPDSHALKFISDIQLAMGYQHQIAVTPLGSDPPTTVNGWVVFNEIGSAINVGQPLRGRVYGQVDYELSYRTSYSDPRRL